MGSGKPNTVILVNPPTHLGRRRSLPFMLGYQESLLSKAGFSVKLLDLQHAIGEGKLPFPRGFFESAHNMLDEPQALVYLFQMATSAAPWAFELMRHVKEHKPEVCTIASGGQVRAFAKIIQERIPWVDVLINTDPEEIIVKLIKSIQSSGCTLLDEVPGISFRTDAGQWQTTRFPVLPDTLDGLPWVSLDNYKLTVDDVISMEVARGCPQGCWFCAGKAGGGTAVRSKSPKRIVQEAGSLHRQMTRSMPPFIMFEAENFANAGFLAKLLVEKHHVGAQFNYGCYARVPCLDQGTMDLLAETGCKYVFLGVESGAPRILAMLKKGMKIGDAERVVKALLSRSILPLCSLIFGFPGETENEWHRTLDYCATLAWAGAVVHLSPLRLEPGSALAKQTGYHDLALLKESEQFKDLTAAGLDPETIDPQIGFYSYTLRNADYEINEAVRLSAVFLRALEQMPLTFYLAVKLLGVRPSQLLKKLKDLSMLVERGAKAPLAESTKLIFGSPLQHVSKLGWLRVMMEHELNRFRISPDSQTAPIANVAFAQLYERLCKAPSKLDKYAERPLKAWLWND